MQIATENNVTSVAVIKFHTYPLVLLEEVGECPWNDPSVSIALSPSSDCERFARTSLSMYETHIYMVPDLTTSVKREKYTCPYAKMVPL